MKIITNKGGCCHWKKNIKNLFPSVPFFLNKQASKQARKLVGSSMLNFSQTVSEMIILSHFFSFKQPSNQVSKQAKKEENESYVEHLCQISEKSIKK